MNASTVTSTGPLGEMSVLPPQVELSEFTLGPRFRGDPNGAASARSDVIQPHAERLGATCRPDRLSSGDSQLVDGMAPGPDEICIAQGRPQRDNSRGAWTQIGSAER